MSVIILVADGARPDTLTEAMDAGLLPALSRLREEGGLHTVTSVFPSTTGPAYTPFLLGRFPGSVGLPGIRWFDRAHTLGAFTAHSRSYVGYETRHINLDVAADAPTLFELVTPCLNAFNALDRGLGAERRIGYDLGSIVRVARAHFTGNVRGWLDVDRITVGRFIRRVREERPLFSFCALTGIDKTSHSAGHASPTVREAMGIVDDTAARLRADAEADGVWGGTHIWIVSDHGHSPVRWHDDIAALLRSWGHRTIAHPWTLGRGTRGDVVVMVSGNAMANLYVEPSTNTRPWHRGVLPRWTTLVDGLLARPSVDLMLLPQGPERCEVRARGRGTGVVEVAGGRYAYRPLDGDPLGIGTHTGLTMDEAHEVTMASDYPDGIVQILQLAGSPRAGDIILSAARDWDFRDRYEPIPHLSSHGALHREHMLVPLLLGRPAARAPRRTVDVMPSVLDALGLPVPAGLDGTSFVTPARGETGIEDAGARPR